MKKMLKIFIYVMLLVLPLLYIGCNDNEDSNTPTIEINIVDVTVIESSIPTNKTVEEFKLEDIKIEISYSDDKYKKINLTEELFEKSELDKLSSPGTHTISFVYEGFSCSFTVTLLNNDENTPTEEPETILSVNEVLNKPLNNMYKVQAIVVGVNAQSFLVNDGTGSILIYKGKTWNCDIATGDYVEIYGKTTSYAKAIQFDADTTYSVLNVRDVNYGIPNSLDGVKVTKLGDQEIINIEYVTITGKLEVSGSYYNVLIEDTNYVGSISYPIDFEYLNTLDGKMIEVTGFFTGISGGKYFNILYTDVKIVDDKEPTPEVPVLGIKINEILNSSLGKYKTSGTVVAVNSQSFLINDGTGKVLVYKGSSWECDLSAGDVVVIEGTTTVYGNAIQFGKDTAYEKIDTSSVTEEAADELNSSELDFYLVTEVIRPKYVTISGLLNITTNSSGNKYYNVIIDGTSVTGSISYPLDKELLDQLHDKVISVTGYVTGLTGGVYLNIISTNIIEVNETSDYITGNIAELKSLRDSVDTDVAVEFTGKVIGFDSMGYAHVSDETGAIYVRVRNEYLQLNNVVTIQGVLTIYKGNSDYPEYTRQVKSIDKIELLYTDIDTIETKIVSIEELANLNKDTGNEYHGNLVTLTGVVEKGETKFTYYLVDNNGNKVAIHHYSTNFNNSTDDSVNEFNAFDGKEVVMTGIVYRWYTTENIWSIQCIGLNNQLYIYSNSTE